MGRITVTTRAGVAWIVIDDPGRRNALDVDLATRQSDSIGAADADDAVGALVVTGAGDSFCAGADRATLLAASEAPEDERRRILETLYRPFLRLRDAGKPTLAVVRGPAVGAGLNLVLAADMALATPTARFMTGFLRLGLHPGGGHTAMLQARLGPQAAAALLLFGDAVDGTRAKELGLVYDCFAEAAMESAAQSLAERAAGFPREALAATRATLSFARDAKFQEVLARELEAQALSLGREETRARLASRT